MIDSARSSKSWDWSRINHLILRAIIWNTCTSEHELIKASADVTSRIVNWEKKPQNLLKQQRKKRQVGINIIIALQLATTCHATIHEFVNQLLNTCYYETRDKEREISDLKQVTSILALTSINCRHRWFTTCLVPQKRSSTNKEQMSNQQEQKARATNCDTNVQSTWTSSFWTRLITVVSISVSLQMVLSSLIKFLINLTSNLILRTNSNFIFDAEFNGNGKSQLFKFRL